MSHTNPGVTLSIRVKPEVREQLAELSDTTGRTKSFLASEAIEHYLATQAWQVTAIKKAVEKADSKKAKFLEHEQVVAWADSLGSKKEQDLPK